MTDDQPRIDGLFRNGTLTGVGVLTGFSLTFLIAWAGNPLPWRWLDMAAVGPLSIGIVLQIIAIAGLLSPDCLVLSRYNALRKIFVAGLVLVAIGIVASLALDALRVGQLSVT